MDKERKLIIDLAEHAAMMRVCESMKRKPGEIVSRLPEEQRTVLKGLKSKHVEGIMPFWLRRNN